MRTKPLKKKEFLTLLQVATQDGVLQSASSFTRGWDKIMDGLVEVLTSSVTPISGFVLGGVGTFYIVPVAEKTSNRRNPATNETLAVTVPAHRKLVFKPMPAFKKLPV